MTGALNGVTVLDFSTLLPGPLATGILSDAGAEVIKIERPGAGDDLRHYPPLMDGEGLPFSYLNKGKKSVALDLKDPGAVNLLRPHIEKAAILVEQFRPGVMDRLGLGYEVVAKINPAIVYCSISGYGQSGPRRDKAGHDLNYIAESGLLPLTGAPDGAPVIPPGLIADIGGGAYPAVMNILLALRQAEKTGSGCCLDISMADNLSPWMWWALAERQVEGKAPVTNGSLLSGGSPRYRIYRTADGRYLAAAPLEQKFWLSFCALIGLPESLQDDRKDPAGVIDAVAVLIAAKTSDYWADLFEGQDVCCSIVATLDECGPAAFAMPVADAVKRADRDGSAPALGEANDLFGF